MSAGKVLFVTAIDSVKKASDPASAKDQLGDIRCEGTSIYKYVVYDGGTAGLGGVVGDPVVYYEATGYANNRVTTDYSDGTLCAGVLQAVVSNQTDATKDQWVWIKIKGLATVIEALEDSPEDGEGASIGTADKKLKAMDAAGDVPMGIFLDASEKTVLLDCPY